jgi:hypothetical protein
LGRFFVGWGRGEKEREIGKNIEVSEIIRRVSVFQQGKIFWHILSHMCIPFYNYVQGGSNMTRTICV